MSIRPRPYGAAPYSVRGPTFIPRQPVTGGRGAGLGGGAGSGSLAGLIGGLGAPILCLGCLSALALVGLWATMIGAAAYMNAIQKQVRKNDTGAGSVMELNVIVLFCALFCSIYYLTKHRRGVAVDN